MSSMAAKHSLPSTFSSGVGDRYSFPRWPSTTTAVNTAPRRFACPSTRISSIVFIVPQDGHLAPARDIVPAPSCLSCSRRCAALPPLTGTLLRTPNSTGSPVASLALKVNTARCVALRLSHVVFSNGTSVRQNLHLTVRAHIQAVVAFGTHRGCCLLRRYSSENSALSA